MSAERQNWRVALVALHRDLVAARPRLGMRQKDVARAMGASLRNFQRFENGEADPSAYELLRWAEVLGLPFSIVPAATEVSS